MHVLRPPKISLLRNACVRDGLGLVHMPSAGGRALKNITHSHLRCGGHYRGLSDQGNKINKQLDGAQNEHSSPTSSPLHSCSSAAIHSGSLSRGNWSGAPIFTLYLPRPRKLSSLLFSIRRVRRSAWGRSVLPGCSPAVRRRRETGASCRQWCGALREKPECCSHDPRILPQRQSSPGNRLHAAGETG